jgi:uncharacterized protein
MNPRKHLLTYGALALSFALSVQASFRETDVTVADGVAGKLVVPVKGKTQEAVLILHGFNDHMDGVGDLQKQLAHALAENKIASLRINFRGEGIRNDSVITSTLESRLADGESGYNFLKAKFPKAKLGVNGWSLGGSTAILLIGTHPEWFQSTVLWSSGGSNSTDQLKESRNAERNAMIQEIITTGKATQKSWVDITLTREFYVSWIGFESLDYLPHYPGAFLGIRGTDDFLPLHEPEWMKILPGGPKAYHVLGGADHIFQVLEPEKSQGDTVVQITSDWFIKTLRN